MSAHEGTCQGKKNAYSNIHTPSVNRIWLAQGELSNFQNVVSLSRNAPAYGRLAVCQGVIFHSNAAFCAASFDENQASRIKNAANFRFGHRLIKIFVLTGCCLTRGEENPVVVNIQGEANIMKNSFNYPSYNI